MKQIICQKCGNPLSKNIELGAGMYYINPSRPFKMYQEDIKCQRCGAINRISVEMNYIIKIRIVNEPIDASTGLTGKSNLNSA